MTTSHRARLPRLSALLMSAVLATVLAVTTSRAAAGQTSNISLLGYSTVVPTDWTPRVPESSMRLAEFTTPGDSASRADVVVYFFGAGQGGDVAANLDRWKAQFSNPDGSPVTQRVTRDSSGAFPITFAEYHGTYARGVGAGSPETARADQTLIAAVAETPRGTLFIQLFGPSAQVSAERGALVRFVKGLAK